MTEKQPAKDWEETDEGRAILERIAREMPTPKGCNNFSVRWVKKKKK